MRIGETIGSFFSFFIPSGIFFKRTVAIATSFFSALLAGLKISREPVNRAATSKISAIFAAKKAAADETPRGKMLKRLEKYLDAHGEHLGEARDDGDCFFDAVRQSLPQATVKSLRTDVRGELENSSEARFIAKQFAEYDAQGSYEEYVDLVAFSVDELKERIQLADELNAPLNAKLEPILNRLQKLTEYELSGNIKEEVKRLEQQRDKLIGQRIPASYPVWGSELRDGKILSKKYKINIEVTSIEPDKDPSRYVIKYPPDAKYTKTIQIALYNPHFVPVWKK